MIGMCISDMDARQKENAANVARLKQLRKDAMGIDWHVEKRELNEAIPPAYTYYLGLQMLEYIK